MKQTGLDSEVSGPLAGLGGAKCLIWLPAGFPSGASGCSFPTAEGKEPGQAPAARGCCCGWARGTSIRQAGAFLTHPAPRGSPVSGYGNTFVLPGTVSYALALSSTCIEQLQQTRGSLRVLQYGQKEFTAFGADGTKFAQDHALS